MSHVQIKPAEVRLGRLAARVPAGATAAVHAELRRLLLAEHAMEAVSEWAQAHAAAPRPADPFTRSRFVDAAGLVAMFVRPFVRDDQRKRLDPTEWRAKVEQQRPDLVPLFDRLRSRRHTVFAHADTTARVANVANFHKGGGSRDPSDPIDLRTYDSGAADEILATEELARTIVLAQLLSELFNERMLELGAVRVRELSDPPRKRAEASA